MWANQETMFRDGGDLIQQRKLDYLQSLVANYDAVYVADDVLDGEFLIVFSDSWTSSRNLNEINEKPVTLRYVGWDEIDGKYDDELSDAPCHLLVDVDYEELPAQYRKSC